MASTYYQWITAGNSAIIDSEKIVYSVKSAQENDFAET